MENESTNEQDFNLERKISLFINISKDDILNRAIEDLIKDYDDLNNKEEIETSIREVLQEEIRFFCRDNQFLLEIDEEKEKIYQKNDLHLVEYLDVEGLIIICRWVTMEEKVKLDTQDEFLLEKFSKGMKFCKKSFFNVLLFSNFFRLSKPSVAKDITSISNKENIKNTKNSFFEIEAKVSSKEIEEKKKTLKDFLKENPRKVLAALGGLSIGTVLGTYYYKELSSSLSLMTESMKFFFMSSRLFTSIEISRTPFLQQKELGKQVSIWNPNIIGKEKPNNIGLKGQRGPFQVNKIEEVLKNEPRQKGKETKNLKTKKNLDIRFIAPPAALKQIGPPEVLKIDFDFVLKVLMENPKP
jgi:hypothetical protein